MIGKKEREEGKRGDVVELRDFIRTSLVDIATGIHEANERVMADRKEVGGEGPYFLLGPIMANTEYSTIAFDIAVTTAATRTGGLKAGISIQIVQAGIGGEKASSSERVSRIKFTVHLERNLI